MRNAWFPLSLDKNHKISDRSQVVNLLHIKKILNLVHLGVLVQVQTDLPPWSLACQLHHLHAALWGLLMYMELAARRHTVSARIGIERRSPVGHLEHDVTPNLAVSLHDFSPFLSFGPNQNTGVAGIPNVSDKVVAGTQDHEVTDFVIGEGLVVDVGHVICARKLWISLRVVVEQVHDLANSHGSRRFISGNGEQAGTIVVEGFQGLCVYPLRYTWSFSNPNRYDKKVEGAE